MLKISARNAFDGIIKDIQMGATTSHVLIDVAGLIVTSSITNDAVEELRLKVGSKVKTIIKSSDVILAAK